MNQQAAGVTMEADRALRWLDDAQNEFIAAMKEVAAHLDAGTIESGQVEPKLNGFMLRLMHISQGAPDPAGAEQPPAVDQGEQPAAALEQGPEPTPAEPT